MKRLIIILLCGAGIIILFGQDPKNKKTQKKESTELNKTQQTLKQQTSTLDSLIQKKRETKKDTTDGK